MAYLVHPQTRNPSKLTLMKRYIFLSFLVLFICHAGAQKPQDKVIETIHVFPYQHSSEADAALKTMDGWGRFEWKILFRLLDSDSLKVTAADAVHAYVNAADHGFYKKGQTLALLNKYTLSPRPTTPGNSFGPNSIFSVTNPPSTTKTRPCRPSPPIPNLRPHAHRRRRQLLCSKISSRWPATPSRKNVSWQKQPLFPASAVLCS